MPGALQGRERLHRVYLSGDLSIPTRTFVWEDYFSRLLKERHPAMMDGRSSLASSVVSDDSAASAGPRTA